MPATRWTQPHSNTYAANVAARASGGELDTCSTAATMKSIDGVRLCKAQRFRYLNNDMADLEAKLKEATNARFKMVATDGVRSRARHHRRATSDPVR